MCLLQTPGYPKRGKREPLPYWVDVQTDLSLCWSHRSYCRFCRALAQIFIIFYLIFFQQYCLYEPRNFWTWGSNLLRGSIWPFNQSFLRILHENEIIWTLREVGLNPRTPSKFVITSSVMSCQSLYSGKTGFFLNAVCWTFYSACRALRTEIG